MIVVLAPSRLDKVLVCRKMLDQHENSSIVRQLEDTDAAGRAGAVP
jgi:hypothetical protein